MKFRENLVIIRQAEAPAQNLDHPVQIEEELHQNQEVPVVVNIHQELQQHLKLSPYQYRDRNNKALHVYEVSN